MPPPNRDRVRLSFYLGRSGLDLVDQAAERTGKTRSDVIRAAIKHGLRAAERELSKP